MPDVHYRSRYDTRDVFKVLSRETITRSLERSKGNLLDAKALSKVAGSTLLQEIVEDFLFFFSPFFGEVQVFEFVKFQFRPRLMLKLHSLRIYPIVRELLFLPLFPRLEPVYLDHRELCEVVRAVE